MSIHARSDEIEQHRPLRPLAKDRAAPNLEITPKASRPSLFLQIQTSPALELSALEALEHVLKGNALPLNKTSDDRCLLIKKICTDIKGSSAARSVSYRPNKTGGVK